MSEASRQLPLVTIGMPVFNGEQWVRQAAESILAQSYENLSLIISDNASTDGTGAICAELADRDSRVRYYRNRENLGVFRNYDHVFSLAEGPYFKWASSSDICKPEFVARCVEVLETRSDVVLAYPKTALFDNDPAQFEPYEDNVDLQDERPSDRLEKLLGRIRLNNVFNGLMRSAALRRTAMNRPYASSDVVLVAELALQGKFVEVPERLFYRRMNRATATALQSRAEKVKFFQYEGSDVFSWQHWKMETALIGGIYRASIPRREKLRSCRLMARRLRHGRKKLMRELLSAFR